MAKTTKPFGLNPKHNYKNNMFTEGKNPNETYDEIIPTSDNESSPGRGSIISEVGLPKIPNKDWEVEWADASAEVNTFISKVNVLVVAPELVSSLMSKYIVYNVKTEPLRYVVRRRYNDFAWLRDSLASKYVGLFIPSIPATTAFSSKSTISGSSKTDVAGDFVKNRMAQLHLFMQQICTIPFLRTDPYLQQFLSLQNEKEFKALTEASLNTGSSVIDEEKNTGLRRWCCLIDNTDLNAVEADRLITDYRRQLDVLRSTLCQVDNECRSAGKRAVACSKAMLSFSDQINSWSGVEGDLVDPKRNEYIDVYGNTKKGLMEALRDGQYHWNQSISLIPRMLARTVLSNVQFQIVQVARFKEHLQIREGFVKDLEKAQKEKLKALEDKHQFQAAQAAAPANGAKKSSFMFSAKGADELDERLQKKCEVVDKLQFTVDRITKALIFCEMQRFNKDRLQSITTLVGTLAATHMQIAQASTTKWSEIVVQAGLDPSQFSDCISSLNASMDDDEIFSENS